MAQQLQNLLQHSALQEQDVNLWRSCVKELRQTLKQLGPEWAVKPFGGAANGFGTRNSDLDVVCYREGVAEQDRPLATEELHSQLLPLLEQHPDFEVVGAISGARVPILKLRFAQKLDVDVSCHNTEPLPNTQLLRTYAGLDRVVRDLGVAIKLWAKAEGVSGAANGHLSSYSLTLLAIYFLQVDQHSHLPVLPVQAFTGHGQVPQDAVVPWTCHVHLTVLIKRFFHFFAEVFQWSVEVASVRLGRRCPATDAEFAQLRGRHLPRLHIEDPFLTGRNLNCVLGTTQEIALFGAISSTWQALKHGVLPPSLCRPGHIEPHGQVAMRAPPFAVGPPAMTSGPPPVSSGQDVQVGAGPLRGQGQRAIQGPDAALAVSPAIAAQHQQVPRSGGALGSPDGLLQNSPPGLEGLTQQARRLPPLAAHGTAPMDKQARAQSSTDGFLPLQAPDPENVPSTKLYLTWRL